MGLVAAAGGEGQALALRCEGGVLVTVARGPVTREAYARASDGEGQARALRYNEGFFLTVARGPVPRDFFLSTLIPPVGQDRQILTVRAQASPNYR